MQKCSTKLKAIDFFCSGGGMSAGLQNSGINILAGIDFDETCKATYEANIYGAKFLTENVTELKATQLEKKLQIHKNDDDMIFIGCSPCQYWSIIRTDKTKAAKSKNLLHEFHRFVEYFNPGYVVVENVPGILEKRAESDLDKFTNALEKQGYKVHYEVINLNHFGIPETRRRFSLIANRVTADKVFPKPDNSCPTVHDFIGQHNGFSKLKAGQQDKNDPLHRTANLSPKNLERLKLTPQNGGNRSSWAKTNLQLNAYKNKGNKKINFADTYSRMHWDKPAPTITTKFFSISNGRFVHPEEDRAISLREGATLQTFSKDYKFIGNSIASIARMIGNAVPPIYAQKIGQAIIENHEKTATRA